MQRISPVLSNTRDTIMGRFEVSPRRVFVRKSTRVLAHISMVALGILVGAWTYGLSPTWYDAAVYALIATAFGVATYFALRHPVWAWQLSLLTVLISILKSGANSAAVTVLGLVVASVFTVRLVPITFRPHRWFIVLVSAFLLASYGLLIMFPALVWLAVVLLFVAFVIDNHMEQLAAAAGKTAAEEAAFAAQEAANRAQNIAQTAQHEVVELGHREAVLRERTRIARDLHDVVAHHMSMVVVRAQTAEYRIADLSDEVKAELGEVAELARQSLTEVRELLAVLRSDTEVALAPQPDLQEVPELLEAARASGMVLDAELAEPLPNLSVAASQAAYRVIQEGLANVRRHAPGALAEVLVLAQGKALVLSVRNGPAENFSLPDDAALRADDELGASSAPVQEEVPVAMPVPGHGLLGLQERVHSVGGLLSSGETSDGGYLLFARLPLGEDAL